MSLIQEITRTEPNGNRMLSINAVAALCEVSRNTVYRWIETEGLPVHRLPSGRGSRPVIRIDSEKLTEWIDSYLSDKPKEVLITYDGVDYFEE